jgi:hypothetical protein
MRLFNRLEDVDGDEVALVKAGANGRRILLRKEDGESAEFADMLSVPWEHEGALTDHLRKEGVDEPVIDATVGALRLLKAAGEDLPDDLKSVVEKLGSEMYPIVNKPLNNLDDAESESDGPNDAAEDDLAVCDEPAAMAKDTDDPDEDVDDVAKRDFDPGVGGGVDRDKLSDSDFAGPNRTFPIVTQSDVTDAMKLSGKAADPAAVKARIAAIARRKGLTPPGGGNDNVKKGGTMSEGTLPVPLRKEDGSWDLSGVPEENRPFLETILKSHDEALESNKALTDLIVKEREELEKERDLRRVGEFVQKAEGYKHLVADPNELGPVLKEIADAVSPESYAILEKALTSADEQVETGDLFKELGRANGPKADSGGDAMSKLEKMAEELVEKSDDLSLPQAFDRVIKTAKGRELYQAYLAEGV